MPFWWLAKLYLVLHCYRHLLDEAGDFTAVRAADFDDAGKLQTQSKVSKWLSSFRGPQLQPEVIAGNILGKLSGEGKCRTT